MSEHVTPLFAVYQQCHEEMLKSHSHTLGELLTLVDAAFADPQQRKAFKDLLCQTLDRNFRDWTRDILIRTFKNVSEITTKEGLFDYYGRPDCPAEERGIEVPIKLYGKKSSVKAPFKQEKPDPIRKGL